MRGTRGLEQRSWCSSQEVCCAPSQGVVLGYYLTWIVMGVGGLLVGNVGMCSVGTAVWVLTWGTACLVVELPLVRGRQSTRVLTLLIQGLTELDGWEQTPALSL